MSLSAFCSHPILYNSCLQNRKFEPLKAVSGLERRAYCTLPVLKSRIVDRGGRPKPNYKKLQIVAGLPLVSSIPIVGPIVNFVLNPTLLTVIYVFGDMLCMSQSSPYKAMPIHPWAPKWTILIDRVQDDQCVDRVGRACPAKLYTFPFFVYEYESLEANISEIQCSCLVLQGFIANSIRFISGFSQTTYSDTVINRFGLTAIWPVLFLASKSFRENFKKAVTS